MSAGDWAFGAGGFVKLYGDRLAQSSLLDADLATRWCFVFVLSQADAEGRFRCASVAGLARAAAVTLEQAELAVRELEAPDPNSTTKADHGRRLRRIPGGWQVVNFARYREYRTSKQVAEAERKRQWREGRRVGHVPGRPGDVPGTAPADVRRQTPDTRRNGYGSADADAPADAPPDQRAARTPTAPRKATSKAAPPSWSTEAADAWRTAYQGEPTGAYFAQLQPIVKRHGWPRVRPVLALYLAETQVDYVSIAKVLGGSFLALEARVAQGPRCRPGSVSVTERNAAVAEEWGAEVLDGKR